MNRRLGVTAAFLLLVLTTVTSGWARPAISLDGQWEYTYGQASSPPAADANWQPIRVPSTLQWRPGGPHCVWYRTTFSAHAPKSPGTRVVLRFQGVKFSHRAFLNGVEVGRHVGGYEPVAYDVTNQLRDGANHLLVAVEDWTSLLAPGTPSAPPTPSAEFPSWVKDALLAPIGSHGTEVGIWQSVSLESRPSVWIDDTYVTTSVREHRLQVQVTLKNATPAAVSIAVAPQVASGGPAPGLAPQTVTVPARGEIVARFEAAWTDPHLWSPHDPHLYTLRVQTRPGGDVKETRFGFREVWTQGDRFFLNGQPIHLLATAAHPMAQYDDDPARAYALAKSVGCVAMRLHAQPWPEQWYRVADETGMLLIWESALWCNSDNYALTKDEFWRNAQAHLAAQIKLQRNHPSIVIWSAENELLDCGGDKVAGAEQKIGAFADVIRRLDPTRPIMFEGDADPAGKADIINLHYPHEFPKWNQWPETAYWFDQTIRTDSYPNRDWHWDRKKPLYLGEFLWVPDREVDAPSIFLGDAAYPDIAAAHREAKAQAWMDQVIAARDAGVMGLCPWNLWEQGAFPNVGTRAYQRAYQPIAAFPREPGTRAFAGSTVRRTFMVFNDSGSTRTLELRWRLAALDGSWQVTGAQPVTLPTAGRTRLPVTFTIPEIVPDVAPARLTYELWEGSRRRFGESQAWRIFRRLQTPPRLAQAAVCDPGGETVRLLTKMGVHCLPFTEQTACHVLARVRVAVIGKGVFADTRGGRIVIGRDGTFPAALSAFVRAGGTLLVLEQQAYPSALVPVTLSDHDSTLAFIARLGHPALMGLTPADLTHWGDDGVVGRREIVKPSWGGFLPLVDSGGERGLMTAGLAEVRLGAGRLLLCQLEVVEKAAADPAADRLLRNLLTYAATPVVVPKPTAVVCHDAEAAALAATGLRYERLQSLRGVDLARFGQVICDADLASAYAGPLRGFVRAGGRVLLHEVTPASFEVVRHLLGQPMTLTEGCDGWVKLTDRDGPGAGISSQDLAWFGPLPDSSFSAPSLLPGIASFVLGRAYRKTGPETRVEAKAMRVTCPAWGPDGSAVSLYTNGELATDIEVPANGLYEIALRVRGTPADGIFARMAVSVDGTPVGSVSTAQDWRTLPVVATLPAGRHTLQLAFVNDLVSHGEDRNVWVDWMTWRPVLVTPSPLSFHTEPGLLVSVQDGKGLWVLDQVRWEAAGDNDDKAGRYLAAVLANLHCEFAPETGETIPAAHMTATAQIHDQTGDGVTLATAGTLDFDADFAAAGPYRFGLLASGTAVDGIYPRVEVRIDGATVGTIDLRTGGWRTYHLTAPVPAGPHHVTLAYVNDEWKPPQDRNLSVAQLIIGRAR